MQQWIAQSNKRGKIVIPVGDIDRNCQTVENILSARPVSKGSECVAQPDRDLRTPRRGLEELELKWHFRDAFPQQVQSFTYPCSIIDDHMKGVKWAVGSWR